SWSLNPQHAIEQYEIGTANLDERIEAAKLCREKGWRIRIRIDPCILYPDWKTGYSDLIRKTLTAISPENITLGMLRILPGHFHLAKEAYGVRAQKLLHHQFVKGASDSKLRYPPQQRVEFYNFLVDTIRSFNKTVSIGLCRETPEIWRAIKDRCDLKKCNCLVW
ncbi:MAG: hypothetical protein MUP16_00115, partial [Sedimentisphaerales bacterium]|nr:hypothetical protein [Sedimentisphaerales bacterium]